MLQTPGTPRLVVIELGPIESAADHDAVMMDIAMLLERGGGRERSRGEFEVLFRAAGLRLVGVTRAPGCPLQLTTAVVA